MNRYLKSVAGMKAAYNYSCGFKRIGGSVRRYMGYNICRDIDFLN